MSRRRATLFLALALTGIMVANSSYADEEVTAGPYVRLPEDGDRGVLSDNPTFLTSDDCKFENVTLPAVCLTPPTDYSNHLSRTCQTDVWGEENMGIWYDADKICSTKVDPFTHVNILFRAEYVDLSEAANNTQYANSSYTSAYASTICGCLREYHVGCFPYGVKIKMADGSTKPVEEVAAGDKVWSPRKKQAIAVKKVIESPEKEALIQFGYEQILVKTTNTHPVVTAGGIKKAGDLTLADQIQAEDGSLHQLTVFKKLPVNEGETVVNFILDASDDDGHLLVSDGIVTGDMELQAKLNKAPKEAR